MKNNLERPSQDLTAGAGRRRSSGAEDSWRNIR
jgi:hypothetical protein